VPRTGTGITTTVLGMATDPNSVELGYAPDGTWRLLTDEEKLLYDVGALMALKHGIGSHCYRDPVAILAPASWCPDAVSVMALPVWRSEQATKPVLVYAP
jgi:hypothetical protein